MTTKVTRRSKRFSSGRLRTSKFELSRAYISANQTSNSSQSQAQRAFQINAQEYRAQEVHQDPCLARLCRRLPDDRFQDLPCHAQPVHRVLLLPHLSLLLLHAVTMWST